MSRIKTSHLLLGIVVARASAADNTACSLPRNKLVLTHIFNILGGTTKNLSFFLELLTRN